LVAGVGGKYDGFGWIREFAFRQNSFNQVQCVGNAYKNILFLVHNLIQTNDNDFSRKLIGQIEYCQDDVSSHSLFR